jgi:hypothetical protein
VIELAFKCFNCGKPFVVSTDGKGGVIALDVGSKELHKCEAQDKTAKKNFDR